MDYTLEPPQAAAQKPKYNLEPPQASAYTLEPPKPAVAAPAPAGAPAPLTNAAATVKDIGPEMGREFGETWEKLKSDFQVSEPEKAKLASEHGWDRLKDAFKMSLAKSMLPLDAFNFALSGVSGLTEGALVRPAGRSLSALTGLPQDKAEGLVNLGLVAAPLIPKAGEIGAAAEGVRPNVSQETLRKGMGAEGEIEAHKAIPGKILEAPKEGETTKGAATRIDDGLYRLQTNGVADKVEMTKDLEETPPEISDPKLQERLYHEIEAKMVDPNAKISPEAEAAFQHLQPLKTEEAALSKRIHEAGYGDLAELPATSVGYVHRIVKGKGHYFDRADPEASRSSDVITGGGGRTLSKHASSLQPRKFYVLEDAQGNRVFAKDHAGFEPGQSIKGSDGRTYTAKLATTREIEANTPTRYFKNALINTADNVLRLRRVDRNIQMLNELKPQLVERGLFVPRGTKGQIPAGYEPVTLPQLEGYADPKIAHVLNDFHGQIMRGDDLAQALSKANRFLVGSMFFTPIPHAANVMNHWIVGRGWEWLRPTGWASLARNGTRAIKAVVTQNEDAMTLLREGSAQRYGDTATANFYKLMVEKMGNEILHDPQSWAGVAKDFGFHTPVAMVKQIYRSSSKALWAASDMMLLQRTFELMDRGLPMREAIRIAENDIPNYRVPSEVMGQRWLRNALVNPNITMFGRYRYGQFKAYATMFRDLAKGTPKERMDAAGKFLVLAGLGFGAYPFADQVVRKITGNKQAEVQRMGPYTAPHAMLEMTQGQKDWLSALSTIIVPAPSLDIFNEARTNRDVFGREIVNPQSSPLGKATQLGEAAAGQAYPVALAEEMTKPGGTKQALSRLALVKNPPAGASAAKQYFKRKDKKTAVRRESKDEIEQMVKRFARAIGAM